jgi:hypothetical protein
LHKEMQMH